MPIPEPAQPVKIYRRSVSQLEALDAFNRTKPAREGKNFLIRFNLSARIEHLVLTVVVIMLAFTGLTQTFGKNPIGQLILLALGGLSGVQSIHHLFAILLGVLGLYHALRVVDGYFIHNQAGSILPSISDMGDLVQMMKITSKKVPLFDRYKVDQKFLYWVTIITLGVAILTGIVIWFPTILTRWIPGSVYGYAQVVHRWQAFIIVVLVVLLHGYQILAGKMDVSVFTGRITLEQMRREHPVELAYLHEAAEMHGKEDLPQYVTYSIQENTLVEEFDNTGVPVEEKFESETASPIGQKEAASATSIKAEVASEVNHVDSEKEKIPAGGEAV